MYITLWVEYLIGFFRNEVIEFINDKNRIVYAGLRLLKIDF